MDADEKEALGIGTASRWKERGFLNHCVEERYPPTKTLAYCTREK